MRREWISLPVNFQGICSPGVLARLPLRPWKDTSILTKLDACFSEYAAAVVAEAHSGSRSKAGGIL
jgi:hypothetical protein